MHDCGTFYGAGTGPGDPELMTLRAVRLIRENHIIAFAGTDARNTAAYRIALQAVPELAEKKLLSIEMPMTKDRAVLAASHRAGADCIESVLRTGENVVFLTLGDPSLYSTFSYLQKLLLEDGFPVESTAGIPSFCAAAAKLGLPLVTGDEPLRILPAPDSAEDIPTEDTLVFLKAGRHPRRLAEVLEQQGRAVAMVENCGMEGERILRGAASIPEHTGYFSILIAKRIG